MTELDFDELDKAVNNLMSQPATTSTKVDDDTQTTPPANSSSDSLASSTVIATDSESSDDQTGVATTVATPVAQRRGQFMDVMHPSAKMRSTQPQTPKPRVSRQGQSITPDSNNQTVEEVTKQEPMEASSFETSVTEVSPASAETKNLEATSSLDGQTSQVSHLETVDDEPADTQPLTSPFLADAKVEKRPLGTPIITPSVDNPEVSKVEEAAVDMVEQPLQDTVLPAELASDVMQVESKAAAVSEEQAAKPQASEQVAATMPAQTSIPPQYSAAKPKVPTVESDSQAASMYDLGDGPLKVPNKKKSSWPIVIGALVLIVLGVAGSVGLFLLNHS